MSSQHASSIFVTKFHQFPYASYRFPGQSNDEAILFVTREHVIMLLFRRVAVVVMSLVAMFSGVLFAGMTSGVLGGQVASWVRLVSILMGLAIAAIGWWWVSTLWQKSLAIVSNKRLLKFIYTTPFNRHTLSLPLEMIVDTGAYDKGLLQAIFKLGTFTARSSASSSGAATDSPERINKKYFYIENVSMAEDLQHYVNKLLSLFRRRSDELISFRPFIPKEFGGAREKMITEHPEYWG